MAIEEDPPAGIPEWVVTFGDMMSLLLTFFILLFSMSEPKEEGKIQEIIDALRKQFGQTETILATMPGDFLPRNSDMPNAAVLGQAARNDLFNGPAQQRAARGQELTLPKIRHGEPRIGGIVYFLPGSNQLNDEAKQQLQDTAEVVKGKLQKIEIRGHTSRAPLPSDAPYRDHMDLAYARCRQVQDYMVSLGIKPERFRLAPAGDYEPAHIGSDPELQKRNERVEVFMVSETVEEFQGTEEERSQRFLDSPTP